MLKRPLSSCCWTNSDKAVSQSTGKVISHSGIPSHLQPSQYYWGEKTEKKYLDSLFQTNLWKHWLVDDCNWENHSTVQIRLLFFTSDHTDGFIFPSSLSHLLIAADTTTRVCPPLGSRFFMECSFWIWI